MDALFQRALAALKAGDLASAEAACRSRLAASPSDAAAMQLLAMTQHRLGQLEEAQASFARSVELAPRNPEFRTNCALLLAARGHLDQAMAELERALVIDPRFRSARLALARISNQVGRHEAADAHARKLIAADERDSEAWSALGTARYATGRAAEARVALERAVSLAPRYGAARYALATVLCAEERAEQALEHVHEASRLGIAHRELTLTQARALVQLDRYAEAESVLTRLLGDQPHDVEGQFLLAQLRKVRGDEDCARSFRAAAERADAPLAVRAGYADVVRRLGDNALAEQLLRELLGQSGPSPALLGSLGTVLHESGRYREAVDLARQAFAATPADSVAAENLVAALLSAGEPGEALPIIEQFRASAPADQRWITYRADVARQRGEELFAQLFDFEKFVRIFDLPAPPGYASMGDFNAEFRAALQARHVQASHPLDQSMRGGTQTSRGLAKGMDPIIDAFLDSLAAPIAEYQAALARDAAHPFLVRNAEPAQIVGCWSVRLKRGGFHVNHIHPQGWLSSAYYVQVPAEANDTATRSGWIKFGEPRLPQPDAEPRHFVQPRPGRLVLFPSYMWHGTVPIQGDEPRLTVAFDAAPGGSKR